MSICHIAPRMPPPDLEQVGFGDWFFSIADVDIFLMGETEISRRRVAQFTEGRNDVRNHRIILGWRKRFRWEPYSASIQAGVLARVDSGAFAGHTMEALKSVRGS